MSERLCAVAIMAKASVAGTVKTRLVPPLTREEAAELNTTCLADVAANIAAAAAQTPIQGFVAYHPLGSERFFQDLLPAGLQAAAAQGADARAQPAARRARSAGGRLCIGLPRQCRQSDPADRSARPRGSQPGGARRSGRAGAGSGWRLLPDWAEAFSPAAVRGDRLEHRARLPADDHAGGRDRSAGRLASRMVRCR